jgi:acetolactate synthase I/II/III large subunit
VDKKQFAAETVAEAYLALLKDRGVDRLFVNAGTDFASIVEAYGRLKQSGLDLPEVVVCSHENMAVSMAHGTYLGDRSVSAVMLHTSVGTANGICGIFNASRDRIPIVLTAGRSPLFEHTTFGARNAGIHWAQEMFDQAGMLREFVKWDYELRDGVQVEEVVDRAVDVALTEPRGPVYLSLPREVLAKPADGLQARPKAPHPSGPAPSPEAVAALADYLTDATLPIIAAQTSGADPTTVPLLDDLCRRYSIGLAEAGPRYVNASDDHPLHLGFGLGRLLVDADVLCFIDVDVPWTQTASNPRDETVIVQTGPDPHFARYPIRSHRSDLAITTTAKHLLEALAPALEEREGRIDPGRYQRLADLAAERRTQVEAVKAEEAASIAKGGSADAPITKTFMNWALDQVRPRDSIIVNEYWARRDMQSDLEPGAYFGTPPAGGLGWGLPAALGVQMVRPDDVVIAAVGDGAYIFANPAACHHAMAMHNLPVLTIVCTNAKWGAVEGSARAMYPEGYASSAGELTPLARLQPVPDFEKYAEASGGYGEGVSTRAELIPALERALKVVREERRPALVNVQCSN